MWVEFMYRYIDVSKSKTALYLHWVKLKMFWFPCFSNFFLVSCYFDVSYHILLQLNDKYSIFRNFIFRMKIRTIFCLNNLWSLSFREIYSTKWKSCYHTPQRLHFPSCKAATEGKTESEIVCSLISQMWITRILVKQHVKAF